MTTKTIIDTRKNINVQFERKYNKKRRIEIKTEKYDDNHYGFLVSYTPIHKWTIGEDIEYYQSLTRAIFDYLPNERFKLVINSVDDFGYGKYMKLYADKSMGVYIYPLTSYGNYVVRHILFGTKPNEDESTFNIERFRHVTKESLPSYLKIEQDGECFDKFEI